MKRPKINPKQLIIGALIVVVIFLMADFNSRMSELNRLKAQEKRVAGEVTSLVQTQIWLETQIAYATSEAAVEAWAREQGRLAQEGDNPVVPLPAGDQAQPTPAPLPVSTLEPVENWEVWLALFFDRKP